MDKATTLGDFIKIFLFVLTTTLIITTASVGLIMALMYIPLFYALFVGCVLGLGGGVSVLWTRRLLRFWRQEQRIKQQGCSPLAEKLMPDLLGNYAPDVIEAAELLGEARDGTAVPALITALERCMENQPPGWSERASALANALARIGDRRALPLLYRLDNVRGIGLIPAVRNAIAAIEPQTSLLRPGSIHDVPSHALLRSVQHRPDAKEAAILLRSADGDPS